MWHLYPQIWLRIEVLYPTLVKSMCPPCQISSSLAQHVGPAGRKTTKSTSLSFRQTLPRTVLSTYSCCRAWQKRAMANRRHTTHSAHVLTQADHAVWNTDDLCMRYATSKHRVDKSWSVHHHTATKRPRQLCNDGLVNTPATLQHHNVTLTATLQHHDVTLCHTVLNSASSLHRLTRSCSE